MSIHIWQKLELDPEPKLWRKVGTESEPNINNFGSATLVFFIFSAFKPLRIHVLCKNAYFDEPIIFHQKPESGTDSIFSALHENNIDQSGRSGYDYRYLVIGICVYLPESCKQFFLQTSFNIIYKDDLQDNVQVVLNSILCSLIIHNC